MNIYHDVYRAILMSSFCFACIHAEDAGLLQKVRSGELTEAKASWWGYDTQDSTAFIQEGLSSGVKRLIIDRQSGPWIVTPLKVPSDIEIFFEKGVDLLAKRGEFKGKGDCLLELTCVSNVVLRGYGATLRMRRDDYDAPPYIKAEWRHVLSIRGCSNVKVIGLTLAESGGDGIYLGSVKSFPNNRDVLIKDVICDRNYRQGISVITAENLLIENTIMRDTAGTPPAAGIDFEPNTADERLKNVVMRNCLTSGNAGDGYEFYLPNLHKTSEPLSIRLEKCESKNDRSSVRLATGNPDDKAVRGSIGFYDCVFRDAERCAVEVTSKSATGAGLEFVRCVVSGSNPAATSNADVVFSNRGGDLFPVGGVRFVDLIIEQTLERPWITWINNIFADQGVGDVSGNVVVSCKDKNRKIELTPQWLKENFPPRFSVRVPRVDFDWSKVEITDLIGGVQKLQPLKVRRMGIYYFYARSGNEVQMTGEQLQVGRHTPSGKPLIISTLDDAVVKKIKPGGFKDQVAVSFNPIKSGFYKLTVDVESNSFRLNSANVPVAFPATHAERVNLISSTGVLLVPVPKGTKLFAFDISGSGTAEAVGAQVINPLGKVVWENNSITELQRFTADKGEGGDGGLWQIKVMKPENFCFEDFSVDVLGVPGCLFLHPQRYWEF